MAVEAELKKKKTVTCHTQLSKLHLPKSQLSKKKLTLDMFVLSLKIENVTFCHTHTSILSLSTMSHDNLYVTYVNKVKYVSFGYKLTPGDNQD